MSGKKSYLLAYNGISTLLWSYILYNNIIDLSNGFFSYKLNEGIPHKFIIITQLINSSFEIFHSVVRLVPSPLATLFLQSFARLIIMIGICFVIPESPANFNLYIFSGLIFAWSITEIIRYGFYFLKLWQKNVPFALVWLRYSAFFVLYPLGLICESITVYDSYSVIEKRLPLYSKFLKFALPLYLPGFLYLYNYMIKQRRKVLRNEKQKLL
ncbi:uncharacterized protein KGF55_005187 [Candida pseudojiufengensis]|uniref:uncharacterized protein n=1 Tax=Candida pseudojiufengensis TaxID=497109 RepID=UPI00222463A8|nr:uncharacterized protein KGF55_005187 [Candida pseudojiufengensis]KAI5959955.1 hypothetical protein KGF55_005187 [Candida pseudojiufengensis]